ncbi:diguanylate cyclase [Photobacterium sp.]|uniref:GGDEF domain-containing protein n=1 Tax=Photobacterium sp. TaxID=660 RepID=UPI00299D9BAF|nr:diguanylate cyclase [Photobacterium sp.]MDX1300975.1 diguanylate cyclase [Photobacterium sp.]
MVKTARECDEYAAVIAALPDVVFILTESGRYADIFGGQDSNFYHDGSVLKGVSLFDVLPHDKAVWFLHRIQETLSENKLMVFEYTLAGDDVENINNESGPPGSLWFEGRVNPLKSLHYGERAVVWVARNITERHELEKELKYKSEVDALSGTFNRRKLFEHLSEAFYTFQRYKENFCFLLIDIDDFKRINDTHGHQSGDEALRFIANTCQSEIRHTDIMGRLGGDEFGIIHRNASIASSSALAKRLNGVVARRTKEKQSGLDLSISIGIGYFKESDYSVDQIYKRADVALYQSKRNGKNCYSVE